MALRTLTIRGVPDPTLRSLRARAAANRRSLNSELLVLLEQSVRTPTERLGEIRASTAVREVVTPYRTPARSKGKRSPPVPHDAGALADVCRRFSIRRLSLFGSLARGEARSDSDLDLIAEFEPGMTPGLGIIAVAEALRPVFGGRRVDLVTPRGLSPALRDRILAEAVPLHGA